MKAPKKGSMQAISVVKQTYSVLYMGWRAGA